MILWPHGAPLDAFVARAAAKTAGRAAAADAGADPAAVADRAGAATGRLMRCPACVFVRVFVRVCGERASACSHACISACMCLCMWGGACACLECACLKRVASKRSRALHMKPVDAAGALPAATIWCVFMRE